MPTRRSRHGQGADGRAVRRPEADAYARRAIREALEIGFTTDELDHVLGPHGLTDLVRPYRGEDVPEYGRRAAGEIMVRYLRS
ncbi:MULTISPECIES: hypothetical protein [unclassified Methylobacterium]|jgi:hypothetical protein|uniref:hypothetical protein n=1 Tax=unclassified Methylobacterium TaxID=2615210 RepID=UPI0013556F5E|nr:hypothetical protein [Methylobacterium sp. 2A]MWV24974.1 hypothetical protein [Methylobacterium sp. 2A]